MIDLQLGVPAFTGHIYFQDDIFGITVPIAVKEMREGHVETHTLTLSHG
jgi:hypothetical protein